MTDLKPEDRAADELALAKKMARRYLHGVDGLTDDAAWNVASPILRDNMLENVRIAREHFSARTEGRRSGEPSDADLAGAIATLEGLADDAYQDIGAAHQEGGRATEGDKDKARSLHRQAEVVKALAARSSAPPVEAKPAEVDDLLTGTAERPIGSPEWCAAALEDLKAARDEAALPEAVAWRFRSPEYGGTAPRWVYSDAEPKIAPERGYTVQPLYAHPATGTDELPADVVSWDDAPLDVELWGVYGPGCFPTVFACRMNNRTGDRALWGFSVYKGRPGYRTLGVSNIWAEGNGLKLFTSRQAAFSYVARQFPPFASRVPHESGGGHG